MAIVPVRLPQMGEGLQEALLVEFLKQPGDRIERDEPLYVMETDKASTEVESPVSGRVVEWLVKAGSVLPIGTIVANVQVDSEAEASSTVTSHHAPSQISSAMENATEDATLVADAGDPNRDANDDPRVAMPPRTRKYLKDLGLLDKAASIPRAGTKLMPEDVDRYLQSLASAHQANGDGDTRGHHGASERVLETAEFTETEVPRVQQTLNYRLLKSAEQTIPVTLMTEVRWEAMDRAKEWLRSIGRRDSAFSVMLLCVVETLVKHPRFRTSISTDGLKYKTYAHVHLGIAVALPGDALVMAKVESAERLKGLAFLDELSERIELAKRGTDQADSSMTLTVSNIGSSKMRFGIPAVVAPAMATLALGEVYEAPYRGPEGIDFERRAQLTLTFDHRVVNGVGAAEFLNDLKLSIEGFQLLGS